MLDPARLASMPHVTAPKTGADRAVFRMVSNDRMAGSIPAWVRPNSAQESAISSLSRATASQIQFADAMAQQDATREIGALSYQPERPPAPDVNEEPFGFGDLIDMVNPLHHIPLVNIAYRHLTGDQIRPVSQIVGGALFGGPMGAASGMVNMVIQHETGHDIATHAYRMASGQSRERNIRDTPPDMNHSHPRERLAVAGTENPQHTLPGAAMAFVDLTETEKPARVAAVYKFNR